ncbi:MAG: mechanosensitive ion channel domain-containing protein [Pseudohongiellaceae bacterium]
MEFDATELGERLMGMVTTVTDFITDPYLVIQTVILGCAYLIANYIARRSEPVLEEQARKIKDSPELLRVIIALLRRLQWLYFAILNGVAWSLLQNFDWPNAYLIYISMLLSMTWLLITGCSQTIRNRPMRRFVSLAAWFYVAMVVLGIDGNVSDLLDSVGFSISGFRISLLLVVKVVVILGLSLWGSIVLSNFAERRIQRNEDLTPGLRLLIGKIFRISLIILAAVIAISAVGIDLTVLSVLTGAVGVGIGFGLQKVVSNFISGIIILADRSIRPGDTISLGETFGWIRELRARFVSVVTRDGREYLIPNEDFITREVINWSFSDELVRLDVEFGVAYESDAHHVTALAIDAALSVERVIKSQQPVCWMTKFGDSSLDFVLRFWIRDPQRGLTNIRGQVLIALWDTLRENGVVIPYPHREIVYKNTPNP